MKKLAFSKAALKALRRMPAEDARRIRERLDAYAAGDPRGAKRLRGRPELRLRVGDWRVLFSDDGLVVAVLRVGARGDVYKGA